MTWMRPAQALVYVSSIGIRSRYVVLQDPDPAQVRVLPLQHAACLAELSLGQGQKAACHKNLVGFLD